MDDEDYDFISHFSWAQASDGRPITRISVSRLIMKAKPGNIIDHINGNVLDNRKSNLRLATHTQNMQNAKKHNGKVTSLHKGVSKILNRWRARITINGITKHLGMFKSEEDAAIAYNIAAQQAFKEFARLNPKLEKAQTFDV